MIEMNVKTIYTNDISADLDERQRSALHSASHKAFRVVMLILLLATVVANFVQDDLRITLSIAGIVVIGMITQWFYLRRFGIDKELDMIRARVSLQQSIFDRRNMFMGIFVTSVAIASAVAKDRMSWRAAATAVVTGIVGMASYYLIMKREAKHAIEFERVEGKTPSYNRGQRIGAWIARIIGRG